MEKILIEAKACTDKTSLHEHLQRQLMLPSYYGKNLDALWDILTTLSVPRMIVLEEPQLFAAQLGRYGETLLQVFRAAARQNSRLLLVNHYRF